MPSHSHGNGGGCAHEVADVQQLEPGMQYTMNHYIDTDKMTVLNEAIEGSGVKVFKEWSNRLSREDFVESEVDEELLFNIPFTGHVKITGLTVAGDMDNTHPASLRIFKDRPSMSFEDAEGPADQEFSLKQDSDGRVDYPLKASKFGEVTHLTLHFPTNFGSETTRIYYIGLRGEFRREMRQQVVMTTYESKPMMQDHKGEIPDAVHRGVF